MQIITIMQVPYRVPARPRLLIAKVSTVWLWPGIPLTELRGSTVRPIPSEAMRFWLSKFMGPEIVGQPVPTHIASAADHLSLGDETSAQRSLDRAPVGTWSPEGAMLAQAVAVRLGIGVPAMPIAKRMPLWDRSFIQGLAPTFDRFAEAADLLEKAGRWDERWAAGSSDGKPGAFKPGDGDAASSASSAAQSDFGKPGANQEGRGAAHRRGIRLAAADEDDLIPGERDNLDETLEQNTQRLQSQAPISSRPLNLPSGPTYLTTPGTPIGPGGKPLTGPYANLRDPPKVGPGKNFTRNQKAKMYQQNLQTNGGTLRDDDDGQELVMPRKSQRGVTPPPNEAQIDHTIPRKPRDPDAAPGSNSYGNGRIIAGVRNRDKSNKRGK